MQEGQVCIKQLKLIKCIKKDKFVTLFSQIFGVVKRIRDLDIPSPQNQANPNYQLQGFNNA